VFGTILRRSRARWGFPGRLGERLRRWLRFATGLYVAFLLAAGLREAGAQEAPEETLTVPGVRIRTREGKVYEGLLGSAPNGRDLVVKNAEGSFPVPPESVESRERVRLDLKKVFRPGELLGILAGREQPGAAEEADRPGTARLRERLGEWTGTVFRISEILRRPEFAEPELQNDLAKLRAALEDLALRRTVFQAEESGLEGDYEFALAQIQRIEKSIDGSPADLALLAEIRRLQAQIEEGRGRAREEAVVDEIWRSLDASLKSLAMNRQIRFPEARDQVTGGLPARVLDRVRKRLNFSPEDPSPQAAWEHRSGQVRLRHAYGEASWVAVNPEARPVDEWWRTARDEVRYALLKGMYVEKHLAVVHVVTKTCGGCGGDGSVGDAVCPLCEGLKLQRVVIYR